MSGKPNQRTTSKSLAISPDALVRLLEAKEREADARLAKELDMRCRQVQFQEALSERMGRITDVAELAEYILQALRREIGGERAVLALVAETHFLEVVAMTGPTLLPYEQDLLEEAFVAGETLAIDGADGDDLASPGTAELPAGVSLLAIPLFKHDRTPLGVLLIEGTLDAERQAWLPGFLATIGLGLEDCLHYARIESLIRDAVIALALAQEQRGNGKSGQTRRVEALAAELAIALGLTPTQQKHVRMLAWLHDLAPEAVVRAFGAIKRGGETARRWQALMANPFVGGIYASPLADFQRVLDDLRALRCRWDGRGNQPDLRGEEIPLAARIVAVAEAFARLTDGRSVPAALAALSSRSGGRFDPAVIDALQRRFADGERELRITRLPELDESFGA